MDAIQYRGMLIDNYLPGVECSGTGDFYSCRRCGVAVLDVDDSLERHATWHEEQQAHDVTEAPIDTYLRTSKVPA